MTDRDDNRYPHDEALPHCDHNSFCAHAQTPEIPMHRMLDVRRKIREGFYDRPDVMRETAGRILDSGDME